MATADVTVHAAAMPEPTSSVFLLEDEHHVRLGENLLVAGLSFVFFWGVFVAAWVISSRRVPEFAGFSPGLKADWCSRVNSTIHAVAVVIGVSVALGSITWGDDFMPMSSIRSANFIFSVAIGYFLCDLIVIIAWPIPMQWVFIVHHTVAVVPYAINNFISCCGAAQFGLLLFLLVELATLPLNARGFLESVGREETKVHTRSIYATYVVWAVSRTVLPMFLLYSVWAYTYPSKRNHDVCFYPNLIGAHIISLFCIGVFFFVHTPEMRQIRKERRNNLLPTTTPADAEAIQTQSPVTSAPVTTRDPKKIQKLASGSYEEVEMQGVVVQPSSARAFT